MFPPVSIQPRPLMNFWFHEPKRETRVLLMKFCIANILKPYKQLT